MMDRKNAGIEYDREAFIPAADRLSIATPVCGEFWCL